MKTIKTDQIKTNQVIDYVDLKEISIIMTANVDELHVGQFHIFCKKYDPGTILSLFLSIPHPIIEQAIKQADLIRK